MKLVSQRGANTEKVCREPDMSTPLWRADSHDIGPAEGLVVCCLCRGNGAWGRDYPPFSFLGIGSEKSVGGYSSSSSSTKPVPSIS